MTNSHLLIFCSLLLLVAPLQAARFEVAQNHPQASDDGPGSAERPWKTVSQAAESVGPGDQVVIRGGVYRERVVVKASGTAQQPIRFQAAPGEFVVLTGADLLTRWTKAAGENPVYTVAWPHRFNAYSKTMTHPGDDYHRVIGRCEQVMVNGYLLRQLLSATQLAPGTFFADVTNQLLSVWDSANGDLNKSRVEASVRQEILRVEGAWVRVGGLHFRYAANAAQHGAVVLAGNHDELEDCVVEEMNASGAAFLGEDLVVRRCTFRENGQLGFGANRAHRLRFTECLVEHNNTKNFSRGWEAGGDKLALCRGVVLEQCRFVRNRGNGIWFDIGNEQCTVRQCLIADNEDAGIFYEISYGLHAHDNVIVGNGFAPTAGAWGAQAGICLSSSPDCLIERNLLVGNREGFNFREQLRTTPTIDHKQGRAVWNHDEIIRHNIIAYNRDAQVWGWFDVKDNRHWPASETASAAGATGRPAAKPGDLAADYGAKDEKGQPRGLSLEKLNLRFENNVYFAGSNQGLFKWGPTWTQHRQYPTLAEFQAALSIDRGGKIAEPPFADLRSRDFRLGQEAMTSLKENYPPAPVPGVRLGAQASGIRNPDPMEKE